MLSVSSAAEEDYSSLRGRNLCTDRQEDKVKMEMECKKADAIVLTYACDRPQTLERLSSYWLPELRQLEVSTTGLAAGWFIC